MDDWSRFWAAYPKRVAKQAAKRRWDALIKKGVKPARIMAELSKYVDEIVINKTAKQYIANPATWLNREDFSEGSQTAPETLPFDKVAYIERLLKDEPPPVPVRSEAEKARAQELMEKFKRGVRV